MTSLAGPLAAALGLAAAFALDRLCAARGLLPPGFRAPWRRGLAGLIVAAFLAAAVFLPLASAVTGVAIEPPNLSKIDNFQLFELHVIMVTVMGTWLLLGFAGRVVPVPALPAPHPPGWEEIPGGDLEPVPPVAPAPPMPPWPPVPM